MSAPAGRALRSGVILLILLAGGTARGGVEPTPAPPTPTHTPTPTCGCLPTWTPAPTPTLITMDAEEPCMDPEGFIPYDRWVSDPPIGCIEIAPGYWADCTDEILYPTAEELFVVCQEVPFTCERAVDYDTYWSVMDYYEDCYKEPDAYPLDTMAETGYPRWQCSRGCFVDSAVGQSVVWKAPETPGFVTISLWDNDLPEPVTGLNPRWSRDDQERMVDHVQITVIDVEITNADITCDNIGVVLKPTNSGLVGTLKIELVDPDSQLILQDTRSAGTQSESFNIPTLGYVREHYKVRATWTVGRAIAVEEYDYHLLILGPYLHTQYNTPLESDCGGDPTSFCYTSGSCSLTSCEWSTDGYGKSGWLSEVNENGSGYSSQIGWVSLEWFCDAAGYPAPDGCTEPFLRDLSEEGCPYCEGEILAPDGTVAVFHHHPYLECGDRVFIYDPVEGQRVGITRRTTDYGGGLAIEQMDHYTGVSGCNKPGNLFQDNRMTIKIFQ